MSDHYITSLIEKLEAGKRSNELDVQIECALFTADDEYESCRPNNAGTKVIYTLTNGSHHTCWARDWSMERHRGDTITRLRAQSEARV